MKKKLIALTLSLIMALTAVPSAVFASQTENTDKPVVATTHGEIMGEVDNDVMLFRGIPYGSDCSGENRFLPAEPAANWEEVLDCT